MIKYKYKIKYLKINVEKGEIVMKLKRLIAVAAAIHLSQTVLTLFCGDI